MISELYKKIFIFSLIISVTSCMGSLSIAWAADVEHSYPVDLTYEETNAMKAEVIQKLNDDIQALDGAFFLVDPTSAKAELESDLMLAKTYAMNGWDYWNYNKLAEVRAKITGESGEEIELMPSAMINGDGLMIILPKVDGTINVTKIDSSPVMPSPRIPPQGQIGEPLALIFIFLLIVAIILGAILVQRMMGEGIILNDTKKKPGGVQAGSGT